MVDYDVEGGRPGSPSSELFQGPRLSDDLKPFPNSSPLFPLPQYLCLLVHTHHALLVHPEQSRDQF